MLLAPAQDEVHRLYYRALLNITTSANATMTTAERVLIETYQRTVNFIGSDKQRTQKLIEFCSQPRFINDMLKLFRWKDRTKFRRKFVSPLITQGLLEMTIPEKPNSRNQRYITTQAGLELFHKLHKSWQVCHQV